MAKNDVTVAVEPATMSMIEEIARYESLSKKDVVRQAIKIFYNSWCDCSIETVEDMQIVGVEH